MNALNVDIRATRGEWVDCLCPLHLEKRPSFAVNIDTGRWICRHDNAGGVDIVSLVRKVLNKTHREAVEWVKYVGKHEVIAGDQILKYLFQSPEKVRDSDLIEWTERYYNLEPDIMAEYWFDRGFTTQTMRKFEVRYDPNREAIIWPIKNSKGLIVGFTERDASGEASNKYKYLYPKGFQRTLYPLNRFSDTGTAIIVEGALDAIWMHQNDYTETLCVFGGGITQQQARWLKANVSRVILCFDNDEVGKKATEQAKERLSTMNVVSINLPTKVKDVQELNKEELAQVFEKVVY